jgi:hypothetical protein
MADLMKAKERVKAERKAKYAASRGRAGNSNSMRRT